MGFAGLFALLFKGTANVISSDEGGGAEAP